MSNLLVDLLELVLGHKVLVSRAQLVKAWREQVASDDRLTVSDPSGVLYNSAFNDFCKAIGLKEGK